MRKLAAASLIALGVHAQAHATGSAPSPVPLIGVGTLTCGDYLASRKTPNTEQDELYVQWAWGYMAAYNILEPLMKQRRAPVQPPSHDTVLAYFDKACQDNPLLGMAAATIRLVHELAPSP